MLRANLFRFAKSPTTWLMTALLPISVIAEVVVLGHFAPEDAVRSAAQGVSSLKAYGVLFVSNNALTIISCLLALSLACDDMKTGAIRNVLQARGGRVAYALSTLLAGAVATVLFALLGIAASELSCFACGVALVERNAGATLSWLAQVVAVTLAYMSILLLLAFVVRNEIACTIAVLVLASGMLEQIAQVYLANAFAQAPALRDCLDNFLAAQLARLGSGLAPTDPAAFVPCVVTILAAGAACAAVMRRREIR